MIQEKQVKCPECNKLMITRADYFFKHCGKSRAVKENLLNDILIPIDEPQILKEQQTTPTIKNNPLIIVKQEQLRNNATSSGAIGDLTSPISPELNEKKEGVENPHSLEYLEKKYKWNCENCKAYFNEFLNNKFCPNCEVQLRE